MTVAPSTDQLELTTFTGAGAPLSAIELASVRAAIEDGGAILLRGFDIDLAGFAGLGNALCSSALFNESPNRERLHDEGRVQSVNLGADPFPLHPELAREPWRPDLAMFACLGAPGVGGQTNVCDGIALAEALPPELTDELASRKLIYIRPATAAMLRFWLGTEHPSDTLLANPPASCPYWFRKPGGQIVRGFNRPVLERTIFQDLPAFANFLLFARDYLRLTHVPLLDDGRVFPDEWLDIVRAAARRITYAHRWERGDVLILDNSRFMHGRRAIADSSERRIATFFGYLKGVGPRPGEPEDPPWRRETFVPPETPDQS